MKSKEVLFGLIIIVMLLLASCSGEVNGIPQPQMRVILPNDTILPFVAAFVLTLQLIAQMWSLTLVVVFTVLFLIVLAVMFWPRGRELSTEWIKEGPVNALPASPVVKKEKGLHQCTTA